MIRTILLILETCAIHGAKTSDDNYIWSKLCHRYGVYSAEEIWSGHYIRN